MFCIAKYAHYLNLNDYETRPPFILDHRRHEGVRAAAERRARAVGYGVGHRRALHGDLVQALALRFEVRRHGERLAGAVPATTMKNKTRHVLDTHTRKPSRSPPKDVHDCKNSMSYSNPLRPAFKMGEPVCVLVLVS